MIDLTTPIIPYEGTGIFKLDSDYHEVKSFLATENISYSEEVRQTNENDPPWIIIYIPKNGAKSNSIGLSFAKNRLFRICLSEDFAGALPNGINLNTTIDEAKKTILPLPLMIGRKFLFLPMVIGLKMICSQGN